jgi:hypothetical protein
MATAVSTAWGRATIVDELVISQRAGEKRFKTHVQLLEGEQGETLVRFAYSSGDVARRGPVTLRGRDLAQLRRSIGDHRRLAEALGLPEGGEAV